MDTKDVAERAMWTNSLDFLMSCIANSIGLGNVWRFPFVAYENGGGAFLIPYIIVLMVIGKPIYYMEMIIGQFTSRSSIKMYDMCPFFRGVGLGQLFATLCIVTYYASLIGTTLFYLVASFSAELPWARCLESWGADCVDSTMTNGSIVPVNTNGSSQAISSSELYFLNEVQHQIDDVSDGIGLPNWHLVLCLLVAWAVVFLIIVRGVKSSGKVAYFLAIFPYIVMVIILVRAVTLEGAANGIIFFLRPQWDLLLSPTVWKEAIVQIFFSLGVGMGPIIMYSSYNRFEHNIYRDAMIVTTLDTFTSLLAGITIFAILGNLAHNLKIDNIGDVVKSGAGLAFITYPDAIAKFDFVPQIFSVLFFLMMFVLGIGTVVALQSAFVSVICDQFVTLRFWVVAGVTSIIGFALGLMYITPGGQWMLNLMDYFGGTLLIFALAMFEMMSIFWIYGLENFCLDLEYMTGRTASLYWRICWAFITPVFMTFIFIYSMANLPPLTYSGWEYPQYLISTGWSIFGFGYLMFPVIAVIAVYTNRRGSVWASITNAMTPTETWGPAQEKHFIAWKLFKEDAKRNREMIATNGGHSWVQQKFYIFIGKYR